MLDQRGEIVDWACDTTNVYDATFHPLIEQFDVRMLVETVFSILTNVCGFKRARHRVWDFFQARLALAMAAYHLLIRWEGLKPDEDGFIRLSIARFSF
ncbi:MAG: hypothetical protein KY468_02305 [Armatimonadetes bacterium]|nr:hypothetical protein [Armatimonadota bacterium]